MGRTTHLDPEVTVALEGTLDTFALPDVLRLLAATKKTGRVRVTGPRGGGSVWIDEGNIVTIEAPDAPHATEPVDALFELLRFSEGSFSFDSDVATSPAGVVNEVEALLGAAEALLVEWREIESVVPSMDAWVTLRRELVAPKVVIERAHWVTVVAVGGGATVRHLSDELCLAELPVSRAVRDLVELGLVDILAAEAASPPAPPAHRAAQQPDVTTPESEATAPLAEDGQLPVARPIRARRPRPAEPAVSSTSPEAFAPLKLPPQGLAPTYDPPVVEAIADADADADVNEIARQLATLSPRAAEAVRAAAAATTVEERDAALAVAEEGEGRPINRGLLLKFLSSVKS